MTRTLDRPPLLPITDYGLAAATSLALLGAVLAPVAQNWRAQPRDSFPLSYYPMFSMRRRPTLEVTHLVGFDAHGRRVALPYKLTGSCGLNQTRKQLQRRVNRGEGEAVCRAVANRLAARGDQRYAAVVRVGVVTGRYRLDDYFSGPCEPQREVVHACAPVVRAGP